MKYYPGVMIWAAAMLLAGVGCARRATQVSLPDLAIPVACASEIMLLQCELRVNPPSCKAARVKYHSGCERIVAGN
jgi:hypothetical protein